MNRIELFSAVCHQAWWSFMLGLGKRETAWSEAPEWAKDATRHTIAFYEALPQSGLDIDKLRPVSHEVWKKQKIRDGWVWGPKKDAALKTHPCICPYEQLPNEEKDKDEVMARAYVEARRILGEPAEPTQSVDAGRTGYEAYAAFTGNKNFQGNEMPRWEDLPERIRGAWGAAERVYAGAAS